MLCSYLPPYSVFLDKALTILNVKCTMAALALFFRIWIYHLGAGISARPFGNRMRAVDMTFKYSRSSLILPFSATS